MKETILELLGLLVFSLGIAFALFQGLKLSDNVEMREAEVWKSQGFPIGE